MDLGGFLARGFALFETFERFGSRNVELNFIMVPHGFASRNPRNTFFPQKNPKPKNIPQKNKSEVRCRFGGSRFKVEPADLGVRYALWALPSVRLWALDLAMLSGFAPCVSVPKLCSGSKLNRRWMSRTLHHPNLYFLIFEFTFNCWVLWLFFLFETMFSF